jgi:hypothetical protein
MKEMGTLVEVMTWGTVPWEFANFRDTELATAIMECVSLPPGVTRRDLVAALKAERLAGKANPDKSPNVEAICHTWPRKLRKVALAEALWPVLQAKVRKDVTSGNRLRVPAARVGVRALRMAAGSPRHGGYARAMSGNRACISGKLRCRA